MAQEGSPHSLVLTLEPSLAAEFDYFLQSGFAVSVQVGCSVRELLCGQFGLDGDYVRGRITTIFLDSRAIDNPDGALVRDGARLTLSGAMPGLVGATMRCGGYYAAMRGAMTYRETGDDPLAGRGTIRMKLFNILLRELGPLFLHRGIVLGAGDLALFFLQREAGFWEGCREIALNGVPISPDGLRGCSLLTAPETVRLVVRFADGDGGSP